MPLCGFNRKMLEGLAAFSEGLVEHGLEHRCKENGETVEQGIKREISDMARLIPELHRIDDTARRILTEGIVKYAQGFYMVMRKGEIRDYKGEISKIMGFFQSMDSKYYGELEGDPEDMKQLALYLNIVGEE